MRDIYLRAKGRTVIWRGDMLALIYHNNRYTRIIQLQLILCIICVTNDVFFLYYVSLVYCVFSFPIEKKVAK